MTVFISPSAHDVVRIQATSPKEFPRFWTRKIIITNADGETDEISLFAGDKESLLIGGMYK